MEILAIAATQSQPEEVPDTWRPLKCQLIRENQRRSLIPGDPCRSSYSEGTRGGPRDRGYRSNSS